MWIAVYPQTVPNKCSIYSCLRREKTTIPSCLGILFTHSTAFDLLMNGPIQEIELVVSLNMDSTWFKEFSMWSNTTSQPFPNLAPGPDSLPKDTRSERMTSVPLQPRSEVTGSLSPSVLAPPPPTPFNCSVSQRSWQASCWRKTRRLKQATAVIVGSSSRPNRGIRQRKESLGVLMQPPHLRGKRDARDSTSVGPTAN